MTSFYEQSSEEIVGIFSFTSHTMGKQEERKKSNRKTGKERRKAEKTLRYVGVSARDDPVLPSIDTIWCIGRGGHWGTPMLDDLGLLVRPDFCVDCQHTCDKHTCDKDKKTEDTEDEAAWFSAMEYQLDIAEAMQEQVRKMEERRILEERKIQRLQFMENLLIALKALEDQYEPDDYIPEIDDNFDD